jgi:hypothetical protein
MFPVGSSLVDGSSRGDSDGGPDGGSRGDLDGGPDGGSRGDLDGGPDGARSSFLSLSKFLTDFRPEDHLGKELVFGSSFTTGDFVSLGGDFVFLGGESGAGRLAFHRG